MWPGSGSQPGRIAWGEVDYQQSPVPTRLMTASLGAATATEVYLQTSSEGLYAVPFAGHLSQGQPALNMGPYRSASLDPVLSGVDWAAPGERTHASLREAKLVPRALRAKGPHCVDQPPQGMKDQYTGPHASGRDGEA